MVTFIVFFALAAYVSRWLLKRKTGNKALWGGVIFGGLIGVMFAILFMLIAGLNQFFPGNYHLKNSERLVGVEIEGSGKKFFGLVNGNMYVVLKTAGDKIQPAYFYTVSTEVTVDNDIFPVVRTYGMRYKKEWYQLITIFTPSDKYEIIVPENSIFLGKISIPLNK